MFSIILKELLINSWIHIMVHRNIAHLSLTTNDVSVLLKLYGFADIGFYGVLNLLFFKSCHELQLEDLTYIPAQKQEY